MYPSANFICQKRYKPAAIPVFYVMNYDGDLEVACVSFLPEDGDYSFNLNSWRFFSKDNRWKNPDEIYWDGGSDLYMYFPQTVPVGEEYFLSYQSCGEKLITSDGLVLPDFYNQKCIIY